MRSRGRRPMALVTGFLVLTTTLVAESIVTPQVPALAALPPGELVNSIPNFGWSEGNFSVSEDGAAEYRLPLWTPAARGEVAPELALTYDSRGGNGELGVGWSLTGLSQIEPCPRTLAQDDQIDTISYAIGDAYCLDGVRLRPTDGVVTPRRVYRTENETFAHIVSTAPTSADTPDTFEVFSKDGRILTFGEQTEGLNGKVRALRLSAGSSSTDPGLEPSAERVTAAWRLTRVRDRNGNEATYHYRTTEGGQADSWFTESLLSEIHYSPNRIVRFNYEAEPRSDPVDTFTAGVHSRITRLVASIQMFSGSELLREYRMTYRNNSSTFRSLLNDVTECDQNGVCKRPLQFTWTKGTYRFDVVDTDVIDAGTSDAGGRVIIPGDYNADGMDDIAYLDHANQWAVRNGRPIGDFGPARVAISPGIPLRFIPLARPVDIDRDGKLDLMVQRVEDAENPFMFRYHLYRSDGSTFTEVEPDIDNGNDPNDQTFDRDDPTFLDLDGNGMPDFATPRSRFQDTFNRRWEFRLNHGLSGDARFGEMQVTDERHGRADETIRGQRFWVETVDDDGDGKTSIMRLLGGGPEFNFFELLGYNGTTLVPKRSNLKVFLTSNGELADNRRQFGDVNGDGLVDAIYPFHGLQVQLSSGNGFGPMLPGPTEYHQPEQVGGDFVPGVRIADFNNDGADDVMFFHPGQPTGAEDFERGIQLYTWKNNAFTRLPLILNAGLGAANRFGWAPTQVLDTNGDGVLDIVQLWPGTNGGPDELRVLRRSHDDPEDGIPDLLTGVSVDGVGDRVRVGYTTLGNRGFHAPGQCTYPMVCPTNGSTIVAEHSIATAMAPPAAWNRFTHHYSGARVDQRGRGWLGFARHAVTDEQTRAVSETTFENDFRDDNSISEVYPKAFLPRTTTFTQFDRSGGTAFRRTTTYDHHLVRVMQGRAYTVETRSVTATEEEKPPGAVDWTRLRSESRTITYDFFGNATTVATSTVGGRSGLEEFQYLNDTTSWLIGLPQLRSSRGCDVDGVCETREAKFDYDTAGNLKQVIDEPNRDSKRILDIVPGQFGVVDSTTLRADIGQPRTTRYEYDADRVTPTAVVNALQHRTTMSYHAGLGVPLSVTDPNGVETTMRHDRFGRLREVNGEDGSFEHIIHGVVGGVHFVTTTYSGGGSSQAVFDQLGREKSTSRTAFGGGLSITNTDYDRFGRVVAASRPHGENEARQDTVLEYDNHGRLLSSTEPSDAKTTHTYSGLRTDTVDPKNAASFVVANVDGDIASRSETDPGPGEWLETTFEYGPFGRLAKIIAPDDTEQVMEYDVRGQRVRMLDPSSGETKTTYTPFGEVDTQTNAAGEVIDHDYDQLGRVVRVTSKDGVAINNWDTAGNGIGKLVNARSADGIGIDYRYNPLGKPSTTTWSIAGSQFQVAYDYDAVGRRSSVTYPAVLGTTFRLKVGYVYNQHGYLAQVKDATGLPGGQVSTPCTDADRTSGRCLWTGNSRNAEGQLTAETYGNGVVTANTYTASTGLLARTTATGPGSVGKLADIVYGYDLNRNVKQRFDMVNGRDERYDYDDLNRLTKWDILTPSGQPLLNASYGYDAVGNLTSETVIRTGRPREDAAYTYDRQSALPHALRSRNSIAYSYDLAGRQTGGDRRTTTYTAFSLPKTITWGQQGEKTTAFGYDPNGVRVSKVDNEQNLITIPGVLERRNPSGTGATEVHNLHHVAVGGRVVAQINKIQSSTAPTGPITLSQTTYLHQDLQGSTHLVTNPAGREVGNEGGFVQDLFDDPWGQRLDPTNIPLGRQRRAHRIGYTGHFHDDELGLIDMNGRVYDPEQRRFATPDPVIADPLSGQGLNRYSYVQNNPASLVDPTGFWADDEPITITKSLDKPASAPAADSQPAPEPKPSASDSKPSSGKPSGKGGEKKSTSKTSANKASKTSANKQDKTSSDDGNKVNATGIKVKAIDSQYLNAASNVSAGTRLGPHVGSGARPGSVEELIGYIGDADDATRPVAMGLDIAELANFGGPLGKLVGAVFDAVVTGTVGIGDALNDMVKSDNLPEALWGAFQFVTGAAEMYVGGLTIAGAVQTGSIAAGATWATAAAGAVISALATAGSIASVVVASFAAGTVLREASGLNDAEAFRLVLTLARPNAVLLPDTYQTLYQLFGDRISGNGDVNRVLESVRTILGPSSWRLPTFVTPDDLRGRRYGF